MNSMNDIKQTCTFLLLSDFIYWQKKKKKRKTEYGICWTFASKRYLNPHLMEPEYSSRGHLLHTHWHQCTLSATENFAVHGTASLCMQRRSVPQGCNFLCLPYTVHAHWQFCPFPYSFQKQKTQWKGTLGAIHTSFSHTIILLKSQHNRLQARKLFWRCSTTHIIFPRALWSLFWKIMYSSHIMGKVLFIWESQQKGTTCSCPESVSCMLSKTFRNQGNQERLLNQRKCTDNTADCPPFH